MERMLKSKSVILVYALLLLCVFSCNSETADVSEPRDLNVLLIVADDLNCDIGAYGLLKRRNFIHMSEMF
jgi:hypothetical protein